MQKKRVQEQGRGLYHAPRIYAYNLGTTFLQREYEYSIWTYCRGAQIFRELNSRLKILVAWTVKWTKLRNGDPQILGATIQNLVMRATWRQGFVHPLSSLLKRIMLCPTTDVTINTPFNVVLFIMLIMATDSENKLWF